MKDWMTALLVLGGVFAGSVLCGHLLLPWIRTRRFGQRVRDDGPESHYVKSGTPTFGGFFFLIPLFLLGALAPFLFGRDGYTLLALTVLMLLFAIVGFIDDYTKVRINREGLSVAQKTLLLGLFSLLFTVYYLFLAPTQPFLLLPFSGRIVWISGGWKILYGLFVLPFLFYISNSVNITDGLDGLLSTQIALLGLAFATYALRLGPLHPEGRPALLFNAALAGGSLGFLLFNRHPAKIFMGDTGSQALGAGLAGVSLLMGLPWMLAVAGFVVVFEGLSVTIQFLYFRRTGGRRIFRMAPIHHHFELGGWPEVKVVRVFMLVTALMSILGWFFLGGGT